MAFWWYFLWIIFFSFACFLHESFFQLNWEISFWGIFISRFLCVKSLNVWLNYWWCFLMRRSSILIQMPWIFILGCVKTTRILLLWKFVGVFWFSFFWNPSWMMTLGYFFHFVRLWSILNVHILKLCDHDYCHKMQ